MTCPTEIVEHFAQTWEQLADDSKFSSTFINEKLKILNDSNLSFNPSHSALSIESHINMSELVSCLHTVKGKTPGFDRISYEMLKNSPPALKTRLLSLYNNIFNTGIIPHTWKVASIIPLPKPNKDLTSTSGYRPISLLPCTGKILEKIIAKRLFWFLEKDDLVDNRQVAFKKGRSTLDALLHLDHFISSTLSERNHASILSLDFDKAFDRIGAHVVLNQLLKWKIGPKIFGFIKSFLSNRSFRIKYYNIYSKVYKLKNGIPQGSPLSVVLFSIAFNEISKIIDSFQYMYWEILSPALPKLC